MMERFLLLDVSFGFWDYLRFPIIGIPVALLGLLLIFLGVRAIRRELAKKKGRPEESAQPAQNAQPAEAVFGMEEMPEENMPADPEENPGGESPEDQDEDEDQ